MKLIPTTIALAMISCSSFAATCDFPQHFKVIGGKITVLEEATHMQDPALTVKQTSENSFDVYDNANCDINRPRGIKLKVEADSSHTNEMIFVDGTTGKITIIHKNSLNGYDLDAVNRLSATDYELVYKVKGSEENNK